ncbi:MAG: MGMT family protein [Clostridiales bacterium]|nr:MGMT family protein [Clostridiales bacterium]
MAKEETEQSFAERVYAAVRRIPSGRVASYGMIALLAGNPRASRAVGWALHRNPDPQGTPCYRVVTCAGKTSRAFAFGGEDVQRQLLLSDGVAFDEAGQVLPDCFWNGQ